MDETVLFVDHIIHECRWSRLVSELLPVQMSANAKIRCMIVTVIMLLATSSITYNATTKCRCYSSDAQNVTPSLTLLIDLGDILWGLIFLE